MNNKRIINYLRLSVTDRCNLRCMYCMPEEGVEFVPHQDVLSYEEMLHVVRISILSGIRKIRLTGGEPLVRKGFIPFLNQPPMLDICRTHFLGGPDCPRPWLSGLLSMADLRRSRI